MNEKDLIRKAMAALGRRTSKAKAKAARLNGKKGGRPKILPNGKGKNVGLR